MTRRTNQKAIADRAFRKAVRASRLLADGHYDYSHWANQIDELLSCDHGEAGIGPALQKMAERAARPAVKTYEHRRTDGTTVRVTIPENE